MLGPFRCASVYLECLHSDDFNKRDAPIRVCRVFAQVFLCPEYLISGKLFYRNEPQKRGDSLLNGRRIKYEITDNLFRLVHNPFRLKTHRQGRDLSQSFNGQ